MMMDDRFPQDTLFLFFESDFRFWECHDIPSMQWLPHLLGEKTETTADSASSSSAPAERAPILESAPSPEAGEEWSLLSGRGMSVATTYTQT